MRKWCCCGESNDLYSGGLVQCECTDWWKSLLPLLPIGRVSVMMYMQRAKQITMNDLMGLKSVVDSSSY